MRRVPIASLLATLVAACSGTHIVSEGRVDGGADGGADAGVSPELDGGGDAGSEDQLTPDAGALTAAGGTLADLRFAVVGDTRPLKVNDNADYPTQVITQIFTDIANLSPAPPFAISTGDYQYVDPGSGNASVQVGDYLSARASYPGLLFPTMGNHECTGYTNSECGTGNTDGITENYSTFLSLLLGPIGQSNPYYSIPLSAADGSWTAKIVVTAANAWSQAQQTWLTQAMAQPTTYTFVTRHESSEDASDLSAIGAIDEVINASSYTLLLVGHTHTFRHSTQFPREVIVGNGGVPGTSGSFGFALIARQSDGSLSVQQYDETSGAPTPNGVSFTVDPQGQVGG